VRSCADFHWLHSSTDIQDRASIEAQASSQTSLGEPSSPIRKLVPHPTMPEVPLLTPPRNSSPFYGRTSSGNTILAPETPSVGYGRSPYPPTPQTPTPAPRTPVVARDTFSQDSPAGSLFSSSSPAREDTKSWQDDGERLLGVNKS
jgi:hypothetical protein